MAQRIKIKRSSSATNPADLKEGELAYIHSNTTAGNLYIGRPGTGNADTGLASSIDIIGGLIDHNKLANISAGAEVNPDKVSAAERTAGTETAERSFAPADVKSMIDTHALTGLSAATSSAFGGIKLHSDTAQATAPETVSATANRTYAVQLDANGKASVNVPWSDTDTNTQRAIHDTPVDGATTTSISSNWAFDNVKTAVPANALFTDTTYSVGDGGLTQNNFTNADHTKLDGIEELADVTDATNVQNAGALMDSECTSVVSVKAINQGLATTDDVTFDDLTLTGNIQLDDSGEIKFTSEGLAYDESTNTITSTRIIFDEWAYDDYTANELADIHLAIPLIGSGAETMPAKYTHLFDYNDSGTASTADATIFRDRVEDAVSPTKFSNFTTAITSQSSYYTTIIADLKDGDYDVATASDGSISLGSSSSRFKHLNLSGDATVGGDLDVGGTVSIANIVTQSSTAPIIKLKDTDSTNGNDYKIAVNSDQFEITEHSDLDEAGDTSFSIFKAKRNNAGDGVITAIGGAFDGSFALTVTGGVACTGNFLSVGEVTLGSAAVVGTGSVESPQFPAKDTTVRGSLTVDGDLTVSGTTTTVNTEEILLADNIIELNSNVTGNAQIGSGVLDGGITVRRGTGNDADGNAIYAADLRWNEVTGKWTANQASNSASPILTTANYETEIDELDGGTFS